jgi:formylglycine-generating enzyme required for sulfatase activity
LAGQALRETTDLSKLSSEEQSKLERVQRWQLYLLRSDALPPIERAQAGKTLAILGDPRFCPEKWDLPDDKLLGFIEIPAGPFMMGSMGNSLKFWGSETPQHKVELPQYWIARYPVTLAQWLIFVEENAHKPASPKSLKGIANHPVRWVTWHEAMAYSNWLHQKLIHHASEYLKQELSEPERAFWQGLQSNKLVITLPSEAEWEKAARGTNGRTYPWGEAALPAEGSEPKYANYDGSGIGTTSTVGAFPLGASPYGCEEVSGNVWEWTRTIWGNSYSKAEFVYPYNPNDGREAEGSTKHRVLRGGAFDYDVGHLRCAARNYLLPLAPWGGFRVVVSPVKE